MRKRTGNWGADTPRSPDFKVGLPGKALKYVTWLSRCERTSRNFNIVTPTIALHIPPSALLPYLNFNQRFDEESDIFLGSKYNDFTGGVPPEKRDASCELLLKYLRWYLLRSSGTGAAFIQDYCQIMKHIHFHLQVAYGISWRLISDPPQRRLLTST